MNQIPQKGDVVFFYASPNNLLDWLVAFFSRARHRVVHCAIYWDEGTIIEVNLGENVCFSTIQGYHCDYEIKRFKGITDEQRQKIADCALNQFGETYDIPEIIKLFFKFFGIPFYYSETVRRICSTLVYSCYKAADLIIAPSPDCTPEDEFDWPTMETVCKGTSK